MKQSKGGAQKELVLISPNEYDGIEQQLNEQNFLKTYCVAPYIRKIVHFVKYFIPTILEDSDYNAVVPFNHYESPYPDIIEIHQKEERLFDRTKEVLDVDFNLGRQLELLKKMECMDLPDWTDKKGENEYRYFYNNGWFDKGSADALCYLMQIIKPKHIIEVGSGYSTAVMLDTNEKYFENKIHITCIEPRTDRLKTLLRATDDLEIYEKNLQEIPVQFFDTLGKNDILFIDSSHVSKMNSDVNYIFFEIFPRLEEGVYIHFHDMLYPFIYPKEWIYDGCSYNEMYIIRAFLMNNKKYSVQFFGDMLSKKCSDMISEHLYEVGNGSLWIKKN